MYFVYLLENQSERIYIGFTENLERRILQHNSIDNKNWTKNKGIWELVYFEKFENKTEALKREKYLKNLKAGKRIKQILKIQHGTYDIPW